MDKSPDNIFHKLLIINRAKLIFFVIAISAASLTKSFAQDVVADTPQVNTLSQIDSFNTSISKSDTTHVFSTMHNDSAVTVVKKHGRHSALKAALFTAVLPGLGQAYNKRYWKIPIVYAGFGGLGYALYITSVNFKGFRDAYRQQVATVPNTHASYQDITDPATLKEYENYYKNFVDISSIGIGVWYLLTIVDAAVDAHLYEWNMKDDLSVSWQPAIITPVSPYSTMAMGVAFTLHF